MAFVLFLSDLARVRLRPATSQRLSTRKNGDTLFYQAEADKSLNHILKLTSF